MAAVAMVLSCGVADDAGAQEFDPSLPTWAAPQSGASGPVRVELTPDLWGLGMSTSGAIGGQALTARIPLNRILSNLDSIALGEVDVRKGRLFMLGDLSYARITLPGEAPILQGKDIPVGTTFATLATGWSFGPGRIGRLWSKPVSLRVEPFAGASYTDLDVSIRSGAQTLAALRPTWWSVVIGSRLDILRGRSSIRLEGYVSGLSESRSGQQALVSYGYTLPTRKWGEPTLGIGYRYLFEKRRVSPLDHLQVRLQGPVAAATFHL